MKDQLFPFGKIARGEKFINRDHQRDHRRANALSGVNRSVDDLSDAQLNYLRARLSSEEKPSSKNALQHKDLLDFTGPKVEWLDPLFNIWLRQRFWTPSELRAVDRS